MGQSGPALQRWQDTYGDRGLVVWGISIQQNEAAAEAYWEDDLDATHAWSADPLFSTGQFFPGPMIGTPAWVVVDLSNMEIAHTQEGWSGEAAQIRLIEPYLR